MDRFSNKYFLIYPHIFPLANRGSPKSRALGILCPEIHSYSVMSTKHLRYATGLAAGLLLLIIAQDILSPSFYFSVSIYGLLASDGEDLTLDNAALPL